MTGDGWPLSHWRRLTATDGLSEKTGHEEKYVFYVFSTFSVRFDPFLTSWRPGTRLKSFLEAIRFDSTVYEPVATLKTSNRLIFYVFRPPFRPAASSILTDFVAKRFFDEGSDPVRPIPQDPHRNSAQNDVLASSPSFFLNPFVTKTLFLFETILSKWLLGWGTTFRELKVLSKISNGGADHCP